MIYQHLQASIQYAFYDTQACVWLLFVEFVLSLLVPLSRQLLSRLLLYYQTAGALDSKLPLRQNILV